MYHTIRLLERYKNIYGLHRFPPFLKKMSALCVSWFIPTYYKKIRRIKWIILEICLKKAKKAYFSHLFHHFWQNNIFLENRAQSLFRIYRDLTSCQKSEKINEPIFWKSPGRTHKGQSIGPYLQRRWVQKCIWILNSLNSARTRNIFFSLER